MDDPQLKYIEEKVEGFHDALNREVRRIDELNQLHMLTHDREHQLASVAISKLEGSYAERIAHLEAEISILRNEVVPRDEHTDKWTLQEARIRRLEDSIAVSKERDAVSLRTHGIMISIVVSIIVVLLATGLDIAVRLFG